MRVITYIDGFNLYFGLRRKNWKRYYWLNVSKLSENLCKPNQQLVMTKYFTARIDKPTAKHNRQKTFLEAIQTLDNTEIFYGKYQNNPIQCPSCNFTIPNPKEKMTDVNIAAELLADAFQDNFDTALLITGDSDLIAPIRKIIQFYSNKRVIVAFPPKTFSEELKKIASAYFVIGRKQFKDSLFPDPVIKDNGYKLYKPVRWK